MESSNPRKQYKYRLIIMTSYQNPNTYYPKPRNLRFKQKYQFSDFQNHARFNFNFDPVSTLSLPAAVGPTIMSGVNFGRNMC